MKKQEDLTKDNILKYLTEEQIFEKYLGIPVTFGKRFKNPLRTDDHPDCEFFTGYKKLFFSDYAYPECGGDCFQVAALANGLVLPRDFFILLRVINRDFSLGLFDGYLDSVINIPTSIPEVIRGDVLRIAKERSKIKVTSCKFSDLDLAYWNQFGITEQILKKFNVFRCKEVWIDDRRFYHYHKKDLCYAFFFPKTGTFKIYKPLARREEKWRCNSIDIMGYDQLDNGDSIIITKSLKDIMTLYSVGFQAISSQAESNNFDPEFSELIKNSFDNRLILYDNDDAGIRGAKKASAAFDCESLIFEPSLGVKDASACYLKYGPEFLRDYITKNTKWLQLKNS